MRYTGPMTGKSDKDNVVAIRKMGRPPFHIRFKLFLKYLSNNSMGDYAIYIPRNQGDCKAVVNDILNRK